MIGLADNVGTFLIPRLITLSIHFISRHKNRQINRLSSWLPHAPLPHLSLTEVRISLLPLYSGTYAYLLIVAFQLLSEKLGQQLGPNSPRFPFTIYIGGGACAVKANVRPSTEDIDFYCENEKDSEFVQNMANSIRGDLQVKKDFMNGELWVYATSDAYRGCVQRSIAQDVVFFRSTELMVYAFDYGFQLVIKLDKMSNLMKHPGGTAPEKDQLDAVYFLHEYSRRQRKPTRAQVKALYPFDGSVPRLEDNVFDLVASAYEKKYPGEPAFAQ
jgi:hypothetical protein